ncbi:MAG: hypothetical protein ABS76_18080 [Pelagibacterium sp. SCN 64-44]|nr:MAG: hypothetical protein ABS76_18080 [Pelagibacterium sp. SCN 64-44]
MIITCPHCQTKYQVTYEAIGSVGRKVQCAHCHQAWDQQPVAGRIPEPANGQPEADKLFDAMAEDALDEAMASEALSVAAARTAEDAVSLGKAAADAPAPSRPLPNAAEMKKRQADFSRRQNAMISRLPLARLRRAARVIGVVLLAGLVSGAYFGRVQLVERYPDLAGLYDAVGLGVNVLGLDFSNLETLRTLSGGNDVLMVSAQIVGLSPQPVRVPPVVVSLLDETGRAVYEWSVTPRVRDLMAGERATFDTRLSLPPSEAVRVKLSFTSGNTAPAERNDGAGAANNTARAPSEH